MTSQPIYRILNSYVHHGRIGVLVEFGCDSDFLTTTEQFRCLMHDVTIHVAASEAVDVESLLEQPFVKNESLTVGDVLNEASRQFKEHICVVRFVRWTTDDHQRPFQSPPPRDPAVILKFSRG